MFVLSKQDYKLNWLNKMQNSFFFKETIFLFFTSPEKKKQEYWKKYFSKQMNW